MHPTLKLSGVRWHRPRQPDRNREGYAPAGAIHLPKDFPLTDIWHCGIGVKSE